jgi:hypothetical protein
MGKCTKQLTMQPMAKTTEAEKEDFSQGESTGQQCFGSASSRKEVLEQRGFVAFPNEQNAKGNLLTQCKRRGKNYSMN